MSQRSRPSPRTRMSVFNRDGFACVYCSAKGPGVVLNVDHIVPVSAGGTHNMGNLVTSCAACNRQKAAIIPRAFREHPDVQAAMARRLAKCRCPVCGEWLRDGGTIDDGATKVVYCGFVLCPDGFSGVCIESEMRAVPFTPEQAANPDARWVIRDGSRQQVSA